MKLTGYLLFIFVTFLVLQGCTASQETKEEKKQDEEEVYVFDQVPETKPEVETVVKAPDVPYFIVQIGAFTTREKADAFAYKSGMVITNDVEVKYNDSNNLYVVQVKPYFKTRAEAESMRNKLWQTDGYQDAWIITVQ